MYQYRISIKSITIMNKSFHIICFLVVSVFLTISTNVNAQKVFSTEHEYQAQVKVYVAKHDYQADLLVYIEDHDYRADGNDGKWYFVDHEYQSDINIYFVDHEYQADITVCFVDHEYQAGWRNNDKKHLFYKKKK